jgi:PBP1b-binding outer membrane lipoprotein LpoB
MKKVFSIIAVAILATSFVSCGPSAEEKAKMEESAKRTADSIANAISASMSEVAETAVDTLAAAAATATEAAAAAVEAKH